MKLLAIFFSILLFSFSVFAQTDSEILARANGVLYTLKDIQPNELRQAFEQLEPSIKNLRTELLAKEISDILLNDEAKFRKISVETLLDLEVRKRVANPTEAEIKAVYEANKAQLGDTTYEKIRPRIISFLRNEPEQKTLSAFISKLKLKYKVVIGVDVNSAKLKQTDVLATVNAKTIMADKFIEKTEPKIYDSKANVYEQVQNSLEKTIYSNLIVAEAIKSNLQAEDIIRREISDKMVDYSAEERENLETALQGKLFRQYNYEFRLKMPTPIVQKIDTTNAFSIGRADAPVTIVMFTDFQCPACSATHPFLQTAIKDYQDKIRFVVRNYPLDIHNNAFNAALAAQAAKAQGKFYEYIEVLYQNQEKLDAVSLKKYAADLGLNQKQFDLDFTSKKFLSIIKKDLEDGEYYGISSTPTIFINGVKVRAKFYTTEVFKTAIEKALNK